MIIVVVVKIFCIFEEEEDFQLIVFSKIRVTEISKPVIKQPQPWHDLDYRFLRVSEFANRKSDKNLHYISF